MQLKYKVLGMVFLFDVAVFLTAVLRSFAMLFWACSRDRSFQSKPLRQTQVKLKIINKHNYVLSQDERGQRNIYIKNIC